MSDDLKPHQRMTIPRAWIDWIINGGDMAEIITRTPMAEVIAKAHPKLRRVPNPIIQQSAKKAAHRAKVKAARKQNRGKR